jgi:hypothetical protein
LTPRPSAYIPEVGAAAELHALRSATPNKVPATAIGESDREVLESVAVYIACCPALHADAVDQDELVKGDVEIADEVAAAAIAELEQIAARAADQDVVAPRSRTAVIPAPPNSWSAPLSPESRS